MVRSVKGLIAYLGIKAKVTSHKYKKGSYSIINVSKKDPSKIIREFDKLPYESFEKKRPKHEPIYSYFYPARQLAKCMMRDDDLNLHGFPLRTEMTGTQQIPTSHVFLRTRGN